MDKFRVVNMEKTKFTDKTTPLHTLEIFKQALKSEVQRRRLGSEFSTMKQRVTESIDRSLRISLHEQPSPPSLIGRTRRPKLASIHHVAVYLQNETRHSKTFVA